MKPSFVCLMAPALHLSLASQCGDTRHSPCQLWFADREGITSDLTRFVCVCVCLSFCMLWNSCSSTTVQHGPLHSAYWVFLAKRKRATASVAQLPNVARTGSVTYVCVVRNVGWVCFFAARQLELGSTASLRGALHGSCVYYTAMARRLVWQQLTLDLSNPLPSSWAQRHTCVPSHTEAGTFGSCAHWNDTPQGPTVQFSHMHASTLSLFTMLHTEASCIHAAQKHINSYMHVWDLLNTTKAQTITF